MNRFFYFFSQSYSYSVSRSWKIKFRLSQSHHFIKLVSYDSPKKAKLLSGCCVISDTCSRGSATSKDLSFSMCLGYKQRNKKDLFFFLQIPLPFSFIFMYLQVFQTSQHNFCYQKGIMIVS